MRLRKTFKQIVCVCASLLLCLPLTVSAAFSGTVCDDMYIRVGLYFADNTAGRYSMTSQEGFGVYSFDDSTYDRELLSEYECETALATAEGNTVFVTFSNGEAVADTTVYIEATEGRISVPSGKEFGGMLRFTASDGRLSVANVLPLEEYIKGVLPNEVPPSWEEECLNSAAIAARSFVLSSLGGKHRAYNIDVCSTICCQVFGGAGSRYDSTDDAVDRTASKILTYDGKVALTMYHSSSGGCTESAAGAYGGDEKNYPYLTTVETPFEKYEEYPGGKWTVDITTRELFEYVNGKSAYAGRLKGDIAKIDYTPGPSGYIRSVTLYDPYGNTLTVKNSSNVYSLFSKFVKSSNFVIRQNTDITHGVLTTRGRIEETKVKVLTASGIETRDISDGAEVMTSAGLSDAVIETFDGVSEGRLILDGKGFGHGVGLSQYGARELAKSGKTYDEILYTYFPGTELMSINELYGIVEEETEATEEEATDEAVEPEEEFAEENTEEDIGSEAEDITSEEFSEGEE